MGIRRIYLKDVSTPPTANQSGDTTLQIKPGRTGLRIFAIEAVCSVTGALVENGFSEVALQIGGKTQRTHTVSELDEIAQHYGARLGIANNVVGGPAYVPVRFAQWDREQYLAKKSFALDIPPGYGDNDVQLLIKFLSLATPGTVSFRAVVQDLNEVSPGLWNVLRDTQDVPVRDGNGLMIPTLVKVIRKPRAVSGNAEEYNDITLRDVLQGLYLYDPSLGGAAPNTRISKVIITLDGKVIFERTRLENEVELDRFGLVAVPGIFAVIPDITDDVADSWILAGRSACEIHIDFEAAVTAGSVMKVLIERLGTPE